MALLREALVPLALILFAGVYWWTTRNLPPASTVFPYVVIGFMCIVGVAILGKQILVGGNDRDNTPLATWRAPTLWALSVGFVVLFLQIGFVPAAVLFLCAAYLLYGTRPLMAVIVAAGVTGTYYLLFGVLIGMNL